MQNNLKNQINQASDITIETVAKANADLDIFIAKIDNAKKIANNIRWRLGVVVKNGVGSYTLPPPEIITDEATKAEGQKFNDINEVFYPIAHAARYLKTTSYILYEAIEKGLLYSVIIQNVLYIPQAALIAFKNRKVKTTT